MLKYNQAIGDLETSLRVLAGFPSQTQHRKEEAQGSDHIS